MKKITYNLIKSFDLWYDPIKIGMPIHYDDTVCNFIVEYRHKVKWLSDILYILYRNEFLTDCELRLIAVDNVKDSRHCIHANELKKFDAFLDVATRYALEKATQKEFVSAKNLAFGCAKDAFLDVAKDAARDSAVNSTHDIAWDAAYAFIDSVKDSVEYGYALDAGRVLDFAKNSNYNKIIDKLFNFFKIKELEAKNDNK